MIGTAGDGSAAYNSPIKDYIIFRQSDLSSTTPAEPGGTQNWAEALFSGSVPYFGSGPAQALLTASGVTPLYDDLGVTPTPS